MRLIGLWSLSALEILKIQESLLKVFVEVKLFQARNTLIDNLLNSYS